MSEITNQWIEMGRLELHPENYRKHPAGQIERLRQSLRTFGQPRSIVVWERGEGEPFQVVAGNGLTMAAQAEGWDGLRADIIPSDWTPERVKAYLIADNRLAELSEDDPKQLLALLDEIHAADPKLQTAAGYEESEKDELIREVLRDMEPESVGEDPGGDIDQAEELRQKWGVEPGQLWQLGDHRVICGDCTDPAVVERLMDGERAGAVITDPPYGMNYISDAGGKVANDRLRDFRRLLEGLPALFWSTGAQRIAVWTRWDIWREIHNAMERLYPPCAMVVWSKDNHAQGNTNHFGQSHELCYTSAPNDWVMKVDGKRPLNVINEKVTSNIMDEGERFHLTQKPIKVMDHLLQAMTLPAEIVLDPFLGSGTTLIAAERLGRHARGVELSPAYVAVTLERWHQMTGRQPELLEG